MYRIYKAVYAIKTEQNKTWEECCLRVPVVNIDKMIEEELDGKRRRRRETEEDNWDFSDFDDEEEFVEKTDMSVENYPQPYCGKVSDLPTQCYQESLLELWAVEGEEVKNPNLPEIRNTGTSPHYSSHSLLLLKILPKKQPSLHLLTANTNTKCSITCY